MAKRTKCNTILMFRESGTLEIKIDEVVVTSLNDRITALSTSIGKAGSWRDKHIILQIWEPNLERLVSLRNCQCSIGLYFDALLCFPSNYIL